MATEAAIQPGSVKMTRERGIRLFKWSLLSPLIMLALFLLPIFALQLYFSFHSWTIYLSTWWDAEYVGFEMFQDVFTDKRFFWAMSRSFLFAGVSTLGCFVFGFALALLMYRPFKGQAFFYILFLLPIFGTRHGPGFTQAGRYSDGRPSGLQPFNGGGRRSNSANLNRLPGGFCRSHSTSARSNC